MFAPFASTLPTVPSPETTSLVEAVQNNWSYEQILQILQAKPDGIHEKGWHGFTALHRAALRGDTAIINLLLEHGADVTLTNDYGETPLMYACKRGNPRNVDILIEAGSSLDTADHQGRKAVHHACAGGSVHTLHYLEQVHGVTFGEGDAQGQTPLHVTCFQGFQDAVKYLLRKGRSDLMATDNFGNLPLHIACLNALSETCWSLLEKSCCKTLLVKNKNGKTPLDVLRDGRSLGHQYLYRELEYWSRSKAPNRPPKGPLFSWYGLLTGPFLSFACLVALSSRLGQYGGVVMAIGTGLLMFMVSNQAHRISHISRWPNPVQAGAFFAGISHTMFCYLYKVLPVLWPHTVNLQLVILIPLAVVMVILYYRLLTSDPGTCKTSDINPATGAVLTIEDVAKDRCKGDIFCATCELLSREVKHCKLCGHCMLEFDHHCQFLLSCVGARNHRIFVIFILITTLLHLTFVVHAIIYLFQVSDVSEVDHDQEVDDQEWVPFLKRMACYEGWVVMLVVMNLISFIGNFGLSRFQLNVVSFGLTTYGHVMHNRKRLTRLSSVDIPRRLRLQNVVAFLRGRPFVKRYGGVKPDCVHV